MRETAPRAKNRRVEVKVFNVDQVRTSSNGIATATDTGSRESK